MAIFFIEDTIISCESITYTEDDLNTYIPISHFSLSLFKIPIETLPHKHSSLLSM